MINQSGLDRYSIPFFFDPDMDAEIAVVESCLTSGEKPQFEPVVYGEYLAQRLSCNYVEQ